MPYANSNPADPASLFDGAPLARFSGLLLSAPCLSRGEEARDLTRSALQHAYPVLERGFSPCPRTFKT
jgi:hypothetical protein